MFGKSKWKLGLWGVILWATMGWGVSMAEVPELSALQRAKALAQAGKVLDAGKLCETNANQFARSIHAPQLLWCAATHYEKAGQFGLSIKALQRIERSYKHWKRTDQAIMRQGRIYGALNQWKRAFETYQRLIQMPVFRSSSLRKQAFVFAAKAHQTHARKLEGAFRALPIDSPKADLQVRQILQKIKSYDKLARFLDGAFSLRDSDWKLCAAFLFAEGKESIGTAIARGPIPNIRGLVLTEEIKEQYRENVVRQFLVPLYQDALKRYGLVAALSKQLHHANACSQNASRRAIQLQNKFAAWRKKMGTPR